MYVFLDESGEVGFSKKSSKHLVIALVTTKERKEVEYPIKRIRQRKLNKKLKDLPEFKASNSSPEIKKKVLKELSKRNIEVHTIICKKDNVRYNLRNDKQKFFNYICKLITEPAVMDATEEINLVVDKRSNKKSVRKRFDIYLREQIKQKKLINNLNIKITHKDSQNDRGLQAADYIANAIYRKYEYKDTQYYEIIKEKITTEKKLFFN